LDIRINKENFSNLPMVLGVFSFRRGMIFSKSLKVVTTVQKLIKIQNFKIIDYKLGKIKKSPVK
jgi:hypothetical protein